MSQIMLGFLASLAAGSLTAVGALPILVGHSISRRFNDVLLGFAAGVMLAASFFSLIIPGIDAARMQFESVPIAALVALIDDGLGAAFAPTASCFETVGTS